MPSDSEERQLWRRAYVDRFLADFGLAFELLAPSTQRHLVEWARQAKLVEDQPSSNFQTVVLQLCKAVESELAAGRASSACRYVTSIGPVASVSIIAQTS